jgi:hypothetical protein
MELPEKYKPLAKRCGMTQKEFMKSALEHFEKTATWYYEKLKENSNEHP